MYCAECAQNTCEGGKFIFLTRIASQLALIFNYSYEVRDVVCSYNGHIPSLCVQNIPLLLACA